MIAAILVGILSFSIFCIFQVTGIFAGDSGDLVTAAVQFGIPHPPGYPLYTLLGWLLSKVPLSTVVWRVGLLSSLSHAAVVSLVYLFVYGATRRHLPAIFSAFVLVGNYVFFLYSVTPEVFALLDLAVISLFVIAEHLTRSHVSKKWFMVLFTVAGLSLSHHHMIVCMIPAFLYLYITQKKSTSFRLIDRIRMFGWFAVGLFPYTYIPVAARFSAAVNWDRPITLARFIHLITRADYGTFQSGSSIGSSVWQRMLSIKAYAVFMSIDFTWVGVVLLALGTWWLHAYRPRLFFFWLIAIVCIGPLFAFYANFPLGGRFALGTFERFMLPSYVLVAPIIGFGALQFCTVILRLIRSSLHALRPTFVFGAIFCVLFLLPATTLGMTLWRYWGIRNDQTAQRLGLDILASVPPHAIVLLVHDTPLFVTQFVRYGQMVRPDTTIVHVAKISYPDYQEVLRLQSPPVVYTATSAASVADLITQNRGTRPIVSNSVLPGDPSWAWVPHGMVYLLVDATKQADIAEIVDTNTQLWSTFGDPRSGILSRYKHLMLSNVLDEYAISAIAFGDTLMRAKKIDEAKTWYTRATDYGSDGQNYTALIRLGIARSLTKDCSGALDVFDRARKEAFVPDSEVYFYEGITYRDCVGDAKRAQQSFETFDASQKTKETPLDQL